MVTLDLQFKQAGWMRLAKNYRRMIPGAWGEMSRKQSINIANAYFRRTVPMAPERVNGIIVKSLTIEQRIELLKVLFDLPPHHLYELGELAIEEILNASMFAEHRLEILSGEPVLKYVTTGKMRHYLPELALADAPLVQFVWAEEFYTNIRDGQPLEENLNGLVSVLCSHPIRKLIIRLSGYFPSLGKNRIDWGKVWAKSVPFDQKFAVLMYYYGTRMQIVQLFSSFFSGAKGEEVGPDLTSKYRLWALIHDLAEKGVFGDFHETCYTALFDVLHHVCYNADKYKEHDLKQTIRKKHG